MLQTVLLNASTTWRRLGQLGLAIAGTALIFGVVGAARALHGWHNDMLLPLAGGAVFAIAYARYQLEWQVNYKGHAVRFKVHPIWGERLYIDDALVDRGRPGINITLRGTIESGQGAGERITSRSKAGLFTGVMRDCRRVILRRCTVVALDTGSNNSIGSPSGLDLQLDPRAALHAKVRDTDGCSRLASGCWRRLQAIALGPALVALRPPVIHDLHRGSGEDRKIGCAIR
jgi:hypothetical protein